MSKKLSPLLLSRFDAVYEQRLRILSNNIKQLRKEMSAEDLAYHTGLSRTQINLLENRNANVTLRTICIIEAFFDTNIMESIPLYGK